jgi:hypothetical protein
VKRLLAAFALALAASASTASIAQDRPAAPAAQLDPATLAIAQEVVDLAFPPDGRRQMYARVVDAMLRQGRTAALNAAGRSLDAEEQQILDRYLERVRTEADRIITENSPALFAAFARGYARMFTHDELVQIRAFVATPTGAKYVFRSADLLSDPDVAEANTAYMSSFFATLQPLEAQLRQELIANATRQGNRPAHQPGTSHR